MATRGTRLVYANRWLRLREDTIVRAGGAVGIYSVLEKRDFAIVIPMHDDETMTLLQGLTVHRLSREEFERRARRGEITDCASIAAYGLLLLREPC